MRICVLTHGTMPFPRQYAEMFLRRGHEVELFSMSPCAPVPGVPTRVFSSFEPSSTGSRLQYLRCVLPVRRALRRGSFDVVFAIYLTSAGVVAALSGHGRIVLSALGSDVNAHVERAAWRAVLRWVCRRGLLVHAVSDSLADKLFHSLGVSPSRLLVSPVGVDTTFLALADPARRPHQSRIISTRSHAPVYDHPTLLRAVAILKSQGIACHVTLTHRHSEGTRQCARDLGIADRVTFVPGYEYADLPELLQAHDVYVSCSLSDGTSQSLLEAMSTGLFPVVSDIPANSPWVEQGRNGFLFTPGDAAALAERLAEAFDNPALRARASWISRERVVDRGDREKEANRLLGAFELLDSRD
jgi:glycosyltransferase involved in cell wall biosynthesis